jgi:hypothetical protein
LPIIKKKDILRVLLLGSLLLFTAGHLEFTHGSTGISHLSIMAEAGSTPLMDGVIERLKSTSMAPLPEPADAMLIRMKEWQWHRYLKNALNLPDWIDLGLEHRTRFEVYDHPWPPSKMNMTFCKYSFPSPQRMCSEPGFAPTCILDDLPWTLAVAG